MSGYEDKTKIIITSVPPEAKGGIVDVHQVLFGKLFQKDIMLDFFQVASPNPFDERLGKRLIRIIIRMFQFFYKLINDKSIKIIHINTSHDLRSVMRDAPFIVISRMFRKKIVLQIHQRIEIGHNRIIDFITKHIFSLCDKILVFSNESKKILGYLVPVEKIDLFPNPVIVKDFTIKDMSYKSRLSIPEGGKIVLYLSRLIREKGAFDLIESIPEIIRKNENVYFVFAGEGPDRKQMEVICKSKGIEKHVRFTGHISYKDVIRAFSSADIFVLPTYFPEGMPMAILQAMAAGLPIISTPISSIPDIIKDGINGFLIEPHSPKQLAEKILFLLQNEETKKRIGEANIQLAREEYDVKVILNKLEQLYLSI